jgi:hypothetical protein
LALRTERRRRGDLVAAAVVAVVVLAAVTLLWSTSEVVATTSEPAAGPAAPPPPAAGVPTAFVEAWRAPSAAAPVPLVSADAVVTADGSTVTGRGARTGAPVWTYARDIPLCTAAVGFAGADEGIGRVLALYTDAAGDDPAFCSELTALRPDTGERKATANPDARPAGRLLSAGTSVVATGPDYLEVLRSDLVKTLEYGQVLAPAQPDRQPRPGCRYGSVALVPGRLGVVERCPDETADRLTVLIPDGSEGADKPQPEFSVVLPGARATLVALSSEHAAVALPSPPRLVLVDRTGAQVEEIPLDRFGVTDAELAGDPPGGVAAVTSVGDRLTWWTGARTIALDGLTLTPAWSVDDALGPALPYGGSLLVPVPDGLAEVDTTGGGRLRTIPVARPDRQSPVRLAAAGEVLLEQRGTELVALRPAS